MTTMAGTSVWATVFFQKRENNLWMKRRLFFLMGLVMAVVVAPSMCGVGATTRVAISRTHCYAARGKKGLLMFPINRRSDYEVMPPPVGLGQVYDIFLEPSGRFLFVLSLGGSVNGTESMSGFTVLSLADPMAPAVIGTPLPVPAGPYGAICGKAGTVIVAGGESNLTVWRYDRSTGAITGGRPVKSFRIGKSQDRVLLSNDGRVAYVKGELDPAMGMGVGYGVMIVPLSNPTLIQPIQVPNAPAPLGSGMPPLVFPMESALSEDGKVLFTAHGEGVSSVNVSDPLDCLLLTDVETIPQEYYSIAVVGQRAYAVGYSPYPRMIELDVSDPEKLVVKKLWRLTFKKPVSIAANENFFFIGDRASDCVVVIDRTNYLASWAGCTVKPKPLSPVRSSLQGQRGPGSWRGTPNTPSLPPPSSSSSGAPAGTRHRGH
ncbi:hypothetical protein CBR_g42167 [Chara braunii]|uniref:Uncharacterized protein n=1 Tax=Chara braunii TaxID=69332 RepID=A0A388LX95_CHABU|nr:hypothetical protein CBR_g42167 [Chara braunii]|eukprot:GBG86883.1 hypothetical protein CBR_g42167 [Chara braunii]